MAYNILWLVEERVIFVEWLEEVTIKDLFSVFDDVNAMIDASGIAPVHILADASAVKRFPHKFTRLKSLHTQHHPKAGLRVTIVHNNLWRYTRRFFIKTVGLQSVSHECRTEEDALNFLTTADPTLPDMRVIV